MIGVQMPRINLTDRKLKSLTASENGQIDYWDAGFPGFGVRVSGEGRKSFVFMYRIHGRKRRYTIGTYPAFSLADAREAAGDMARQVAKGIDPMAERQAQRTAGTFQELAALYIESHAKPKKRSWKKDELAIKRDLNPAFGELKANAISQEDIEALLDDIVERNAPIQANRTLEIVRGIFNWAIGRARVRKDYLLTVNPCAGVKKPSTEKERDRVLSAAEIKAVWEAAKADPSRTASAFLIRLMTAQRGVEVHMMRRTDLDLDAGWWTIPADVSKNKLAHRVPLTEAAVRLLRELLSNNKNVDWVFPKAAGDGPVVNIQKLTSRIRTESKVSDFRPHDIRRTVASNLASMGIARFTVAKVLNHVETDVTKVYDRYGYDQEKRNALEAWGLKLEEILSGDSVSRNIVNINTFQR